MIYATASFEHEGKRYHQIKVNTACCKREFLVIEEGPGIYFDIENLCYTPVGMTDSINQALANRHDI